MSRERQIYDTMRKHNENRVTKISAVEVQEVETISTTPPDSFLIANNKPKENLDSNSNVQVL